PLLFSKGSRGARNEAPFLGCNSEERPFRDPYPQILFPAGKAPRRSSDLNLALGKSRKHISFEGSSTPPKNNFPPDGSFRAPLPRGFLRPQGPSVSPKDCLQRSPRDRREKRPGPP